MRQRDREAKVTHPAVTIDVLWIFALEAYAKPGVETACLEAQDKYGADVSLMLSLLWADGAGLTIAGDAWHGLLDTSGRLQRDVLAPLRAERRAAKGSIGYDGLKARELAEEKKAMAAYAAHLKAAPSGAGTLLLRYCESLGIPARLIAPLMAG